MTKLGDRKKKSAKDQVSFEIPRVLPRQDASARKCSVIGPPAVVFVFADVRV